MQEQCCPLCFGSLDVRDVAPCEVCGGNPIEIEHFHSRVHHYAEYEVFPGLCLVLCNFCDVDFGSNNPTYFGLSPRTRIGYQTLRLVRLIEKPNLGKDKFCEACGLRLAFLRFVAQARLLHTPSDERSDSSC